MTNGSQADRPNLYLVGFMASGKTSTGRRVAKQLSYQFIDSDEAIEEKAGKPITEIFSEQGEGAFRSMERDFMENGHQATGCVVSCGGGLVIPSGMAELVASKGVSICLSATPETVLSRTRGLQNRPLLNVQDPEKRIKELLDERNPRYQAVGRVVSTDGRTLAEVADDILQIYKNERVRRA